MARHRAMLFTRTRPLYPSLCIFALALVLSLGLVHIAQAATRFVATSGSDAGANNCLASGSPCKTITHALTQAVANDTISVAAGTYNPALGETFPLVIAVNLTLTGGGAPGTIIDAGGTNRVIQINAGTVTISGVTITGGNVCSTPNCFAAGGGLYNDGTLILTNSTVSGNTASCESSGSGGRCFAEGGGIRSGGTLTLTNSTVSGNTASCTATGGSACVAWGGGLYNSGTTTITYSTVTANTASCTPNGFCVTAGGGLYNDEGTYTLMATIVANQLAGSDCAGGVISKGFNLDSDNTCNLTVTGDQPGVTNPLLGSLANNGGPTQTHALLTGSPAIDAVTSGCPPPATDQRGVTRPQGTACDIGAYEYEVQEAAAAIPTLSEWAQIAMVALLVAGGLLALRRKGTSGGTCR